MRKKNFAPVYRRMPDDNRSHPQMLEDFPHQFFRRPFFRPFFNRLVAAELYLERAHPQGSILKPRTPFHLRHPHRPASRFWRLWPHSLPKANPSPNGSVDPPRLRVERPAVDSRVHEENVANFNDRISTARPPRINTITAKSISTAQTGRPGNRKLFKELPLRAAHSGKLPLNRKQIVIAQKRMNESRGLLRLAFEPDKEIEQKTRLLFAPDQVPHQNEMRPTRSPVTLAINDPALVEDAEQSMQVAMNIPNRNDSLRMLRNLPRDPVEGEGVELGGVFSPAPMRRIAASNNSLRRFASECCFFPKVFHYIPGGSSFIECAKNRKKHGHLSR